MATTDAGFSFMVNDDVESNSKRGLRLCSIVTIIGIPYVCCAILFGLFATLQKSNNQISQASVGLSFNPMAKSNILQSSPSKKGVVVSLGADGKIYNGGGTTIYKNLLSTSVHCPKYLDLDVVFDSSLVMFYSNSETETSTLNIVSLNKDTVSIKNTKQSDIFLNELATLSQSNGIFVGISQCFTASCAPPAVVAGRVSQYLSSITLGKPAMYATGFLSGPVITRLSEKMFAISYYSPYKTNGPNTVNSIYGVVDPVTLDVTISPSIAYMNNANFTANYALVGMTADSYLLLTYKTGNPLMVSRATVPTFSNTNDMKAPIVSAPVSLMSAIVNFEPAITRLDDNTAVVVYADANNNNRVVSVLVLIDPVTNAITFGSSYAVTSGPGLQCLGEWCNFMELDVQPLAPPDGSSTSSFVVLFSDVSNGGRMTATVLGVNAGDLIRQSADFVLTGPNKDLDKYYSWGALAAASNGLMAIMTSVTDGNCSASADTAFSLLDQRARPLGITSLDSAPSDGMSITASGTVSGFSGLTVGAAYYTNTWGELVKSGLYYGSTPVPGTYDSFVTSADGTMLLSADSYVGFASAVDTLVLAK